MFKSDHHDATTPSAPTNPMTANELFRIVSVTGAPAGYREFCAWTVPGVITINIPRSGEYLLTVQLAMGTFHVVGRVIPAQGAIIQMTFEPTGQTEFAPIIIEATLQAGTIGAPGTQQTQAVRAEDYPAAQTWQITDAAGTLWATLFAWPNGGIGTWEQIFRTASTPAYPLVTNTIPHTCDSGAPPGIATATPLPVKPTVPGAPTATPTIMPTPTATPVPLTPTPTETPVPPTPTPTPPLCASLTGGFSHDGHCWFKCGAGPRCHNACSAAGGLFDASAAGYLTGMTDDATRIAHCRAILDGIGAAGTGNPGIFYSTILLQDSCYYNNLSPLGRYLITGNGGWYAEYSGGCFSDDACPCTFP